MKKLNNGGSQPPIQNWLTTEQVCNLLDISKRTLQTYRDQGLIGFSQVKRRIYFKPADVNTLLESHYRNPYTGEGGSK